MTRANAHTDQVRSLRVQFNHKVRVRARSLHVVGHIGLRLLDLVRTQRNVVLQLLQRHRREQGQQLRSPQVPVLCEVLFRDPVPPTR